MIPSQATEPACEGAPCPAADFLSTVRIIRRATASRVAFGALAAAVAYLGAGWTEAVFWFIAAAAWELVLRPALEGRIAAPTDERTARRAFAVLAALNLIGAVGYSVLPVVSWASGTSIGQVLAATWLCGTASHVLVYFSNNVLLLAANLIPSASVALLTPLFAGEAGWVEKVLGSVVLVTILAATGVFAQDRNTLLQTLSDEARARLSAEDANEAKGQFLAIISHELRTPLNAVVGYSEMLGEELQARGEAALSEDAAKIAQSGRQLMGLVNRIIMLSKLESGSVPVEVIDVNVTEVVRSSVEATRALAEANGNRLMLHVDKMGVTTLDAEKLCHCIAELCTNAAKFTKNGEITVIAKHANIRGVEMLQVDVADTGVGIGEGLAERIFQPFVQGYSGADRRFEGAGAGLAVVRALARLMGGEVSCRNRVGAGATFTLRVPLTTKKSIHGADLNHAA